MAKMLGNTPHGCRYAVCRCRHCRGHGQEDEQRRRAQRAREDADVRAYVSRLWAEDWDSEEDTVYDAHR